jgi:hypothetical protein
MFPFLVSCTKLGTLNWLEQVFSIDLPPEASHFRVLRPVFSRPTQLLYKHQREIASTGNQQHYRKMNSFYIIAQSLFTMDTTESNQDDFNQSSTPLQSTALMVSTARTFLTLTPETSVAAMTEEIARLAKLANLDVSLEPKAVPKVPLKTSKACFRGVP